MKARPLRWHYKRAHKEFKLWIRDTRDGGQCFTCGIIRDPKYMACGHYKHTARMMHPLDFNEKNNHCQCPDCNSYNNGESDLYKLKMIEKYGPEILEEIDLWFWVKQDYKRAELDDIYQKYKKQNKEGL